MSESNVVVQYIAPIIVFLGVVLTLVGIVGVALRRERVSRIWVVLTCTGLALLLVGTFTYAAET